MARKIVTPVEVQASVTGDQSVKSFRAQLKEAQQEAFRLAQALGQTAPEAVNAAQKVAELRDQMEDFNATVKGLHPDRFQKFANITATLANGFAAAQGAAALLGSESEDLQKSMARVQGAMAFAQGISGLKDMQFQLGNIPKMIYSKVVPAFTTAAGAARAIGMALGIGVIIAGVTALIALFQKLDLSIDGVSKSDKELAKSQEARLKASKDNVEALDAQDNILKMQGKSERQILEMKIAALKTAIDNQKAVIETGKAQAKQQIQAAQRNKDILRGILDFITKPSEWLLKLVDKLASMLGYDTGLAKVFSETKDAMVSLVFDPEKEQKAAEETQAEQEKSLLQMRNTLAGHQLAIKQIDKQAADERRKQAEEAAKAQAYKDAEAAKQKQDALEEQNKARLEALKEQAKEEERLRKEREAAEAEHQAYITQLQRTADEARTKNYFDKLKRELDGQKQLDAMKADAVMAGLDLINAVTTNANAQSEEQRKREFKRRQAFELANTALSTYFAAQKAYESQFLPIADASSPIRATIAAAMAIASGLGRMAAISKQRYQPGNAGMQQPGGGGGNGAIRQPSMPSSTLGGGTQFAGSFDNKVYVTEGDITGTQRRVRQNRGVSVI